MSFLFFDYLLSVFGINGKKNIIMEENIEQIERFLRDQMNHQEETAFKSQLATNKSLRSLALYVALILKYFIKT